MSNTIPLPATPYVLAIAGDGYSDDHCTSFPAWDDGAMYDHAAAVSAAKDERIKALEDLLWVLAEHNELHFGKSHSTVIQCRAALGDKT